jgi:(S)-2-hydroxy-acid oxidase
MRSSRPPSGISSGRLCDRAQNLKYLAASQLLATSSGRALAAEIFDEGSSQLADYLITSPADALDVFDFQRAAKHVLPVAHYGYLATGTDGNETLTANRAAFDRFYLRPMRMVDTSRINPATTLLEAPGSPSDRAAGSQNAFHAKVR